MVLVRAQTPAKIILVEIDNYDRVEHHFTSIPRSLRVDVGKNRPIKMRRSTYSLLGGCLKYVIHLCNNWTIRKVMG